jgi:hypothetical protein
MKVQWGLGIADARGKVGGHTASANRSGAYIKRKVTPVNPRTTHQGTARSIFGGFSQTWAGLTNGERSAWNAFATSQPVRNIFGVSKRLTGLQMYVRLNTNITNAGGTAIAVPPFSLDITGLTSVTGVATVAAGGTLTITPLPAALGTNELLYIFASPVMAPGISFVKNQLRFIGTLADGAGPLSIKTKWTTRFGTFPAVAGGNIWVETATINSVTGAVSTGILITLAVS